MIPDVEALTPPERLECVDGGPLDGFWLQTAEGAIYPVAGAPCMVHLYVACTCGHYHYEGIRNKEQFS